MRLVDGETLRAAVVVLCAGAYASPAVLLRSGLGPADELARLGIPVAVDLPGVGRNLADHPSVSLVLPYRSDAEPAPLFQIVATLHSSQSTGSDPPVSSCLSSARTSRSWMAPPHSCARRRC